tara:strand:- start:4494 stop:4670 length:177 start_codon:yes stop_codon:yes gene_type:complete
MTLDEFVEDKINQLREFQDSYRRGQERTAGTSREKYWPESMDSDEWNEQLIAWLQSDG